LLVASQFAEALAKGDFGRANELLTEAAKKHLSATELKKTYEGMIAYGRGPAKHVEVLQSLGIWPGKQKDDAGWVYVSISGDDFSEAVSVVVARESGKELIRHIEWGRP